MTSSNPNQKEQAVVLMEISHVHMHRLLEGKKTLLASGNLKIAKLEEEQEGPIYFINFQDFYFGINPKSFIIKAVYPHTTAYVFPLKEEGMGAVSIPNRPEFMKPLDEILSHICNLFDESNYDQAIKNGQILKLLEDHYPKIKVQEIHTPDIAIKLISGTGYFVNRIFTGMGGLVKAGIQKTGEILGAEAEKQKKEEPTDGPKWEQIKQQSQRTMTVSADHVKQIKSNRIILNIEAAETAGDNIADIKEQVVGAGNEAMETAKQIKEKAVSNANEISNTTKDKSKQLQKKGNQKGEQLKKQIEEVKQQTTKKAKKAKKNAQKKVSETKEDAGKEAQEVTQKAKQMGQKIEKKLEKQVDTIEDKIQDNKEKIKFNASDLGQNIKQQAKQTKKQAKKKADEAGDKAQQVKKDMTEGAKDVKKKAEQYADKAENKAEEVKKDMKEGAKDAKKKAEQYAENSSQKISQTVQQIKKEVEEKSEVVSEQAKSIYQATKQKVSETVDGAKKKGSETIQYAKELTYVTGKAIGDAFDGLVEGVTEVTSQVKHTGAKVLGIQEKSEKEQAENKN